MSLNVCTFTGRIGKDCESKAVGNDTVTVFSLAVDVGWGEKKTTLWLRCNGLGSRYEKVAPYLTKGAQIGVSGELSNREWTTKEGDTKSSLELRLSDLALIGAPKAKTDDAQEAIADDFGDREIPF